MVRRALDKKLLEYLRDKLDKSSLNYQNPPSLLGKGYGGGNYTFKLQNPPTELKNTLILRFSPTIPKEGIIQKTLTRIGYPASHIHFHEMTSNALGKPFLIRDYHTGTVLWDKITSRKGGLSKILLIPYMNGYDSIWMGYNLLITI